MWKGGQDCALGVLFFFFKQKTAYEIEYGLVGSEMCIRDSPGDGTVVNFGGLLVDAGTVYRLIATSSFVGIQALSLIHI